MVQGSFRLSQSITNGVHQPRYLSALLNNITATAETTLTIPPKRSTSHQSSQGQTQSASWSITSQTPCSIRMILGTSWTSSKSWRNNRTISKTVGSGLESPSQSRPIGLVRRRGRRLRRRWCCRRSARSWKLGSRGRSWTLLRRLRRY